MSILSMLSSDYFCFVIGAFLATFFAVLLIVPLIIKLYRHYAWDKPHHSLRQQIKDTHVGNLPRGGGLAIGLGLLLVIGIWAIFDFHHLFFPWVGEQISLTTSSLFLVSSIYLGAVILMVIGFFDDVFDLSPLPRLLVNIGVALLLVGAGLKIDFITNPFAPGVWELHHLPLLSGLLTIIYFTALCNITNWAKGVDGQLPGVVVIAALIIAGVSYRLTGELNYNIFLSCLVAGAFAGFLWWNFYPQKILPGFGAGSLAGYFLAVLSILVGAKIATLFMVLALPIADACFTILRRLCAGKSIFLGDRGHLHHKLLDDLGWGRRRIALFYYLTTLLMGVLALLLPTWGKIFTFLLVSALVFYFLIWVKYHHRRAH